MVQGYQLVTIQCCLLPVSLALITLRLWIRTHRRDRAFSWSDTFVVLAFLFMTTQVGLDIYLFKMGFFAQAGNPFNNQDAIQTVRMLKVLYAELVIYFCSMYSIKASLLCFYSEIIPRALTKTWWCFIVVCVYTGASFIASECMKLFWCWPVARNWNLNPELLCIAGTNTTVGNVTTAFHFTSDIFIFLLPFPLLRVLNLDRRQKIGLGLIFGVGFLCVAFSILTAVMSRDDYSPAASPVCVAFEYLWANLVICLPTFKSFLKAEVWSRIKRRFSGKREVGDLEEGEKDEEVAQEAASPTTDPVYVDEGVQAGVPRVSGSATSGKSSMVASAPRSMGVSVDGGPEVQEVGRDGN